MAETTLEKKPEDKYTTVSKLLEKIKPQLQAALPKHVTVDRLVRIYQTSIRNNPKLLECDAMSLLAAVMQSAQLGLEPNNFGQAWIIPYNIKGKPAPQAQFQIGYKGMIDLFYRSALASSVSAQVVYEHDEFYYELGTAAKLYHKPKQSGDRGKPVGYYAIATIKDSMATPRFEYMSHDEMVAFKNKFSKAGEFGPWKDHFEEMAKKTVIKKVLKYMPLSVEIQTAIHADNRVKAFQSYDHLDLDSAVDITDFSVEQGGESQAAPHTASDLTKMSVKQEK